MYQHIAYVGGQSFVLYFLLLLKRKCAEILFAICVQLFLNTMIFKWRNNMGYGVSHMSIFVGNAS